MGVTLDLEAANLRAGGGRTAGVREGRSRGCDAVAGAVRDQDGAPGELVDGISCLAPRREGEDAQDLLVAGHPECRTRTHRVAEQQNPGGSAVPSTDLGKRPTGITDRIRRTAVVSVPAAHAVAQPVGRDTCALDRPRERQHPHGGELAATGRHHAADAPALEDKGHPHERAG